MFVYVFCAEAVAVAAGAEAVAAAERGEERGGEITGCCAFSRLTCRIL